MLFLGSTGPAAHSSQLGIHLPFRSIAYVPRGPHRVREGAWAVQVRLAEGQFYAQQDATPGFPKSQLILRRESTKWGTVPCPGPATVTWHGARVFCGSDSNCRLCPDRKQAPCHGQRSLHPSAGLSHAWPQPCR